MKKGFIYLGAVITISLIAVVLAGLMLSLPKNAPIACTMEAKLCPDGSAVGRSGPNCEFSPCPIDETVTWQTFRNEKYGYEFEYPQDLKLESTDDAKVILGSEDYKINISYLSATVKAVMGAPSPCAPATNCTFQLIQMGTTQVNVEWRPNFGYLELPINAGIFRGGSVIFRLNPRTSEGEKIFTTILSTFKFIEPQATIDTSTWKTYRSEQYGFEVKYPPTWEVSPPESYNYDGINLYSNKALFSKLEFPAKMDTGDEVSIGFQLRPYDGGTNLLSTITKIVNDCKLDDGLGCLGGKVETLTLGDRLVVRTENKFFEGPAGPYFAIQRGDKYISALVWGTAQESVVRAIISTVKFTN